MDKIERFFLISLIVMLVITAIAPPAIVADTSDTIHVTFDPTGEVNISITPPTLNFSTVTANSNKESTASFTLWNNGTIYMNTTCNTNLSTDEGNLTLDPDGTPETDYYSLQFTNTAFEGNDEYIPSASTVILNQSLAPSGSGTFYVTIHLGYINDDYGWQTTTINFTASAAG